MQTEIFINGVWGRDCGMVRCTEIRRADGAQKFEGKELPNGGVWLMGIDRASVEVGAVGRMFYTSSCNRGRYIFKESSLTGNQ